jgi:hypothetical protein
MRERAGVIAHAAQHRAQVDQAFGVPHRRQQGNIDALQPR